MLLSLSEKLNVRQCGTMVADNYWIFVAFNVSIMKEIKYFNQCRFICEVRSPYNYG